MNLMIVMALISWWYGAGWAALGKRVVGRAGATLEFFSVRLLLRTLFDPFRQIDAGGVRGSLQVQLRAFFDRSFSRVVGFMLRSSVILSGLLAAFLLMFIGWLQLLIWPLLPILPVVGFILSVVGWLV